MTSQKSWWRRNVAAVVGALTILPAYAAPLLDQSYDANTSNFIVADRLELAQTFTVGVTGMLTGVGVEIRNVCNSPSNCFEPRVPLVVDVRSTTGGIPTEANAGANILGTASLAWADSPFSPSPVWVNFDLPDFGVQAGDVLAIVLRAPGSGSSEPYVWAADLGLSFSPTPGTYSDGRAFERGASSGHATWGDYPGQSLARADFSFRTFVEPASVPEPGSLALLVLGLAGMGWHRRKRSI